MTATHSENRAASVRDKRKTLPTRRYTRIMVRKNTIAMLLQPRLSRWKLHHRCKGNQAVESEAQQTRHNTQPRPKMLLVLQRSLPSSLVQLGNLFGATFGPVVPHKRSSDWTLRSLFWARGKQAGLLDYTRNRNHTPPHVRMNNRPGCGGRTSARTYV